MQRRPGEGGSARRDRGSFGEGVGVDAGRVGPGMDTMDGMDGDDGRMAAAGAAVFGLASLLFLVCAVMALSQAVGR